MRKIDGYALTLATILAVPYVAAPLLKEDFDPADAPEAPPNVSIVFATTSGSATIAYDTIRDEQIDMPVEQGVRSAQKRSPRKGP